MFVAEGVHVLYQQSQVYQDLLVRTVGPYRACCRRPLPAGGSCLLRSWFAALTSIVLASLFWHPDACLCSWMGCGRSARRWADFIESSTRVCKISLRAWPIDLLDSFPGWVPALICTLVRIYLWWQAVRHSSMWQFGYHRWRSRFQVPPVPTPELHLCGQVLYISSWAMLS